VPGRPPKADKPTPPPAAAGGAGARKGPPDGVAACFAAREAARDRKCKDAFSHLARCTGPQQKATAKTVAKSCR
jgi:hypothetical protein